MLKLYYGRDRAHNSAVVLQEICANAERGVTGQILIVPEQVSFDAERRLCSAGGSAICTYAEVLSFSRLATRVFSVTGGAAVQTFDKSGRLIAMAGALEQVRSRLKLYGSQIAKPEFLLQLLDMVEEFKSYGVNADAISRISKDLSGSLAEKMDELSLIMESYDAVCANAKQDPADRLEQLRQALADADYADGRQIYIDGFSDFTAKELQVVSELLRCAQAVTVTLCCDELRGGQSVFSVPRETAAQLQRMAEQTQCVRTDADGEAGPTAYLRQNLFSAEAAQYPEKTDRIRLYEAEDAYGECLFAVSEIQRLVQNGSRYRETDVACTELGAYQPILENLFARYHIPAYFAGTREVLREPVFKMVLAALEAASSGMEPETVAEYLKSGLTPLTRDACDRLENYAFIWNIRAGGWEKPFTQNPGGYGAKPDDVALAALNEARVLAIQPLTELKHDLSEAKNTAAQILSLNRFLERIGLYEQLQQRTQKMAAEGALQQAQEYGQLYGILIQTMEQVYGVLGETVRTADEFFRFLRAALSQQTVGTIPAAIDCVHVGAMPAMRGGSILHRVVLGASEGLLPHVAQGGSLLSEQERKTLKRCGLAMAPDAQGFLERELLCAFEVLTSSRVSLHMSCKQGEQSYLFLRAAALFENSVLSDAPRVLPVTQLQAAQQLAAMDCAERERVLAQMPELKDQTQRLLQRAQYDKGSLREQTVQKLFGEQIRLSASKIDKYASCRYAYFLNYGLRARERRQAAVDAPLYGTFVHYVLENTTRQIMQEGGFAAIDLERLLAIAQVYIDKFTGETLNQLTDKPQREAYLYNRGLVEVRDVVTELWQELRQSDFRPEGFELKFGEHEQMDAITVQGKKASCRIIGAVDRVDLYRNGEKTYVRVVDYKTGKKDFDYADILCGIGLQMLIYLFALEQSGKKVFEKELTPAGVLYFPARMDVMSKPNKPTAEEAEKERRKLLRRKGLLLDDEQVLQAMEHCEQTPVFLPQRENYASAEQLALLKKHVFDTLADMTDRIFEGNIEPNPYIRGSFGSCTYCEFKQVCHIASGCIAVRNLAATKPALFWKKLEEREAAHGR